MANTAEQPMPAPTGADFELNTHSALNAETEHEDKPTLEQAIEMVTNFVDSVYGPNIPPKVRERVSLLKAPNTIIQNQRVFEEKRDQTHPDKPEHARKIIGGFYSLREDRIFLPYDAPAHDIHHEMLHFVSSHPQEDSHPVGIIRPVAPTSAETYDLHNKANEALTEVLARLIDSGIDIHGKQAFENLARYIENSKNQNELDLSPAYTDYLMNMLNQLRKGTSTSGILPDLAKSYFAGDTEAFEHQVHKRSGLLTKVRGRQRTLSQFFRDIGITATEQRDNIQLAFKNIAERLERDTRMSPDIKAYVRNFAQALSNRNYDVEVLHPELNQYAPSGTFGYVTMIPPIVQTGGQLPPIKIRIDSSLWGEMLPVEKEDGTTYETPFTYFCQAEGYLLWQGLKLDYYQRQGIAYNAANGKFVDHTGQEADLMHDGHVLEHPVIQKFLGQLTPAEFAAVVHTYKDIFHAFLEWEVVDELVQGKQYPPEEGFLEVPFRLLPENKEAWWDEQSWETILKYCQANGDKVLRGSSCYYVPHNLFEEPEKLHGR